MVCRLFTSRNGEIIVDVSEIVLEVCRMTINEIFEEVELSERSVNAISTEA